jgi:hypothetical protein
VILSLVLIVIELSFVCLMLVSEGKLYFVLISYYHFGYVILLDYVICLF